MVITHEGIWDIEHDICLNHRSEFHQSKPRRIPCECCLKQSAHHLKVVLTPDEKAEAMQGINLILREYGIEGVPPDKLLKMHELSRLSF